MSVKITYFVHGTTTDNEQHISSGWKDVDLSELGIQQSKELPLKNTKIWCPNHYRLVCVADIPQNRYDIEPLFQYIAKY